jgi:hypothetical protein
MMAEQSIAILGAPTSGKTTFLAALSIALNRQQNDGHEQGWNVVGADTASRRQLVALTIALAHNHTFPTATALAIERYHWLLIGPVWRTVPRRWFGTKRIRETVQIGLDLADASGELASPDQPSHGPRKDLIDNLVDSRGIVFLFDPISEANRGDAFYYIYSVLAEMAERMVSRQEFADGILPHHVAVCISKFDDVKVLTTAEKLNMIVSDPDDDYGFPRIANEDARTFFLQLCRVLNAGDAELVLNSIERHFRKDRIRYFVTSAIGFYVNPKDNIYDPEDMQNLLEGTNPQDARIRGNVYPINVVEPLMWLAGRLTGTETS